MLDRKVRHQQSAAPSAETSESTVIVQTTNAFEIWLERLSEQCERGELGTLVYRFAVTAPDKRFAIVRVEVTPEVQDEARRAIGPRFPDDEKVWYSIALDALADALDEFPEVFESAEYRIERLSPDQFDIARRWSETHHTS